MSTMLDLLKSKSNSSNDSPIDNKTLLKCLELVDDLPTAKIGEIVTQNESKLNKLFVKLLVISNSQTTTNEIPSNKQSKNNFDCKNILQSLLNVDITNNNANETTNNTKTNIKDPDQIETAVQTENVEKFVNNQKQLKN